MPTLKLVEMTKPPAFRVMLAGIGINPAVALLAVAKEGIGIAIIKNRTAEAEVIPVRIE